MEGYTGSITIITMIAMKIVFWGVEWLMAADDRIGQLAVWSTRTEKRERWRCWPTRPPRSNASARSHTHEGSATRGATTHWGKAQEATHLSGYQPKAPREPDWVRTDQHDGFQPAEYLCLDWSFVNVNWILLWFVLLYDSVMCLIAILYTNWIFLWERAWISWPE